MRRFILGAISILLAGPALAIPDSDLFEITDANGTILTDVNGHPTAGIVLEADEVPNGAALSFVMTGTVSAALQAALTEPATGAVSDNVAITPMPGNQMLVAFASDSEVDLMDCPPTGVACTPETGAVQDLTSLLFPAGGPFHVKVQSDITEVPEPSTALLLAAGLGSMSAARLRRMRSAV